MASGSPEHHMDRLGCRLDHHSCNPVLAPEEWVGSSELTPWRIVDLISLTLRGALFKEGSPPNFHARRRQKLNIWQESQGTEQITRRTSRGNGELISVGFRTPYQRLLDGNTVIASTKPDDKQAPLNDVWRADDRSLTYRETVRAHLGATCQ